MGGEPPVHLIAGDAVVFPQGDAHRMSSQPGLPPAKGTRLDEVLSRRPRLLAYGGGGATTRLVCGYLACDARLARMLLAGLPPLVRVNVRGSNAGVWLEASVRYALAEARSPRPGGAGRAREARRSAVHRGAAPLHERAERRPHRLARGRGRSHRRRRAERAARAPRACVDARGAGARRRTPRGRCSPSASSISWAARRCSTSRSGACCSPPICSARSNAPLARIAEDVGYQTDTAFSRAFRREYGSPPAAWRRSQALSGSPAAAPRAAR